MTRRKAIQYALLLAIPAELLIFGLYSYPVDNGYSTEDSPFYHFMSHIWLALHWPGVVTLAWLERRGASALTEILVFVASGYLQLAVMLAGLIYVIGRLPGWSRRFRAAHSH